MVQRLRICLPVQETGVWSLVWGDSTRGRATKPMSHNYQAHMPRAYAPKQEKPHLLQLEKACMQQWRSNTAKNKLKKKKKKYTGRGMETSLCCCSVAKSCPTLWDPVQCRTPGLPVLQSFNGVHSWSLLKSKPIELVTPSNHLILCPFSSCLQSFPASGSFPVSQLFTPSGPFWSFSFSFDLLAIQGTLKSLLHTTIQKHQFSGTSLGSNSHSHTWLLEKP